MHIQYTHLCHMSNIQKDTSLYYLVQLLLKSNHLKLKYILQVVKDYIPNNWKPNILNNQLKLHHRNIQVNNHRLEYYLNIYFNHYILYNYQLYLYILNNYFSMKYCNPRKILIHTHNFYLYLYLHENTQYNYQNYLHIFYIQIHIMNNLNQFHLNSTLQHNHRQEHCYFYYYLNNFRSYQHYLNNPNTRKNIYHIQDWKIPNQTNLHYRYTQDYLQEICQSQNMSNNCQMKLHKIHINIHNPNSCHYQLTHTFLIHYIYNCQNHQEFYLPYKVNIQRLKFSPNQNKHHNYQQLLYIHHINYHRFCSQLEQDHDNNHVNKYSLEGLGFFLIPNIMYSQRLKSHIQSRMENIYHILYYWILNHTIHYYNHTQGYFQLLYQNLNRSNNCQNLLYKLHTNTHIIDNYHYLIIHTPQLQHIHNYQNRPKFYLLYKIDIQNLLTFQGQHKHHMSQQHQYIHYINYHITSNQHQCCHHNNHEHMYSQGSHCFYQCLHIKYSWYYQ